MNCKCSVKMKPIFDDFDNPFQIMWCSYCGRMWVKDGEGVDAIYDWFEPEYLEKEERRF